MFRKSDASFVCLWLSLCIPGQVGLAADLRYSSEPERLDFAADVDCPQSLRQNWMRQQQRLLDSLSGHEVTSFASPEELEKLNTCLGGHGGGWDAAAGAMNSGGSELSGSLSGSGSSGTSIPMGNWFMPGRLFGAGTTSTDGTTSTSQQATESLPLANVQEVPLESDLAGVVVLGLLGYGCYRRRR